MGKEKSKHKKHKKHKKSKKHKESRAPKSDASCSDDSSSEWVEKKIELPTSTNIVNPSRDGWMLEPFRISTIPKEKRKDTKESTENFSQKMDYSKRELNPYWKNGGIGLPQDTGKETVQLCAVTTGDHGVEWLHKSLQRCKERAREENRSVEDVAAEHWGSLEKLKSLIVEAESRRCRTDSGKGKSLNFTDGRVKFFKPKDEDDDGVVFNKRSYDRSKWRKKTQCSDNKSEVNASNYNRTVLNECDGTEGESVTISPEVDLNSLAAKLLKAKMSGNDALIKELSNKLDNAKKMKNNPSKSTIEENVVILTKTNSQGFCQPVRDESSTDSRQKRKKFETYVDGKRVRYFEDDEKYTLKQMFENEKMSSIKDQNLAFSNLISKSNNTKDTDDIFSDQISDKTTNKCRVEEAIHVNRRNDKILKDCNRCLNSNNIIKHLVITVATKSYLSVPGYQSLTEGHCLIIPMYHVTCGTLVDEDVWQEMKVFCKQLVKMFREKKMDVVFYELATRFNKLPHMTLNCVPLPQDVGHLAPIYFKKAILECEKEWAINKKLVDVRDVDMKHSIPKGLPYFMVNFGMEKGFVHVIENEKEFPVNFAEEVIGGMLEMDHTVWRKRRNDDFETQCRKASDFKTSWENCNWMKK